MKVSAGFGHVKLVKTLTGEGRVMGRCEEEAVDAAGAAWGGEGALVGGEAAFGIINSWVRPPCVRVGEGASNLRLGGPIWVRSLTAGQRNRTAIKLPLSVGLAGLTRAYLGIAEGPNRCAGLVWPRNQRAGSWKMMRGCVARREHSTNEPREA